jgi:superfamily II DNA/RNA helicase
LFLDGKGFEKPSVVQSMAIVPLTQGRDAIVQAQSGTGKTGAFAIGTLARIDPSLRQPQLLVMAPVRELARQNAAVYRELSLRMGVGVACITGGTSFQTNRKLLRSSQIVVCTPGRLIDCIQRGWMRLDTVNMHRCCFRIALSRAMFRFEC